MFSDLGTVAVVPAHGSADVEAAPERDLGGVDLRLRREVGRGRREESPAAGPSRWRSQGNDRVVERARDAKGRQHHPRDGVTPENVEGAAQKIRNAENGRAHLKAPR